MGLVTMLPIAAERTTLLCKQPWEGAHAAAHITPADDYGALWLESVYSKACLTSVWLTSCMLCQLVWTQLITRHGVLPAKRQGVHAPRVHGLPHRFERGTFAGLTRQT